LREACDPGAQNPAVTGVVAVWVGEQEDELKEKESEGYCGGLVREEEEQEGRWEDEVVARAP